MPGISRSAICLFSVLLFFVFFGCDENCVKPIDGGTVEQHYRMYLAEGSPVNVLVLDIPADTIIDSASFSFSAEWLALNPDKSKIFLNNRIDMNTTVIDAFTLQIDTTLPWYGYFHFDVRRNIGLIIGTSFIVKFDGTSFEQLGMLNLDVWRGDLDTSKGHLYANVFGSSKEHIVYVIDYVNMALIDSIVVTDSFGLPIGIRTLLTVPEAGQLYFNGSGPGAYIYDTDSNKVLLQIPLSTANGKFAISGDRKTVYMSDPGDDFLDISGSRVIWVFDVERAFVKDYMSVRVPDSDYFLGYVDVPVVYMDIMPGGNHLYANGGFVGNYPMLHYDLRKGTIINTIDPYAGQFQPFYLLSFKFGQPIE